MKNLNIGILEPYIYKNIYWEMYSDSFNSIQYFPNFSNPELIDILFVGLDYNIDSNFLEKNKLSNISYVVSPSTGVDHIEESDKYQIINLLPEEISEISATAEFTFSLILNIARNFQKLITYYNWGTNCYLNISREEFCGVQLKDKILGIIGVGRIGKKVRDYAECFGMKIMSYDKNNSIEDLKDIFKSSDFISIHLPLNEETFDFIGILEFEYMKNKRPYLINTSRPQIIQKEALLYALNKNRISGVAMDFVSYSHGNKLDMEFFPFLGKKILLTPHIAGNTEDSIKISSQKVVDKLINIIR